MSGEYPSAPAPITDRAKPERGPRQRIVLEGGVLWFFASAVLVLALAPWVYFARTVGPASPAPSGGARPIVSGSTKTAEEYGRCGRLLTFDIVISPPLEFVQSISDSDMSTAWRLRNTSHEQFTQMLGNLPLSETTRDELLAMATPDEAGSGLVLTPTHEFIWSLTPEVRSALYHALALDSINQVQSQAFRFNGSLEEWFANSGVSDETLELVSKLHYRFNKSVFLADLHVLLPKLSAAEQVRVLKAVSGQRSLSLSLQVDEHDNIAELTEYWGRGRRSKDVRPLLESLAQVPHGGVIDVAHLLPSFARSRLYTYPRPSADDTATVQNSTWTAFNFFSLAPEDKFANADEAYAELKANYYPIYRNPALGDLAVFSDDANRMFHVAVYIADDILFTKNGAAYSQPWMYMPLSQLEDFFARPLPVKVSYYRHNSI